MHFLPRFVDTMTILLEPSKWFLWLQECTNLASAILRDNFTRKKLKIYESNLCRNAAQRGRGRQ